MFRHVGRCPNSLKWPRTRSFARPDARPHDSRYSKRNESARRSAHDASTAAHASQAPRLRAARAQAADARSRRSTRKDHHARTTHRNRSPPPRRDGPHADDRERPTFHPVSHRRLRGTGRAVPGTRDRQGKSARPLLKPPVHSSEITSLRSVLVRRCGQPAS